VDTRATDSTDKHLDPQKGHKTMRDWVDLDDDEAHLNEKQIARVKETERGGQSPVSPGATLVADPETPHPKTIDHGVITGLGSPPEPRVRKICGMRRRKFWIAFGVILAVVIAASIIGGVVGGGRQQTAPPLILPGDTLPPPVASGPSS